MHAGGLLFTANEAADQPVTASHLQSDGAHEGEPVAVRDDAGAHRVVEVQFALLCLVKSEW